VLESPATPSFARRQGAFRRRRLVAIMRDALEKSGLAPGLHCLWENTIGKAPPSSWD
jgi:hypothetical protein